MRVPLSMVSLGDAEKRYVTNALESGWISASGEYVRRLEQAVAAQCGRRHAIAVTNGTSALEVVLQAMDIGPGNEVIVPALTFVAPAAAVRSVGATPVFADITKDSWTINPEEVKRHVTRRTRAVISVDVLGHPCDYDRLLFLGIPVIEDAAEAHGALYKGKPVGAFGVASTFSFHANKIITMGEGGCVVTDDETLADTIRIIASHGMIKNRPYWHSVVGHNFQMTNVTAAIGLGQVERWDSLVSQRSEVGRHYDRLLSAVEVTSRPVADWATAVCWLYTLSSIHRDKLVEMLRAEEIDARAIWPALCDLLLYQESVRGEYPVARSVSKFALWLPTWTAMPKDVMECVAERLARSCEELCDSRKLVSGVG